MDEQQHQAFRPAAPDKIGDRFVAAGLLTQAQVAQIVACQHAEHLRFGEAAQRLGLLSEEAIQSVLAQQFRYATAVGPAARSDPSLVIASAPFSSEAEAVRRVRAELSIRLSGLAKLAVAIVSPSEGEGKSYLAASLAIAYSQAGQRTLLINANLRASGQSDLFGMGHHEGLSTMLAGRSAIEPGKPAPGFPGLNVLGAGPRPPNPLEILREPALERLIATFSEEFDVFIVDTPAAGTSSDAQVIARQVGQCLLVGRQHTTRLEDLERTQSQMQTSGAQTVGIVYNTFDPRSRRPVRSGLLGRLQSWVRRI